MDQEYELQELSGTVENVIFKNEENGYTVLRLKDGNGKTSQIPEERFVQDRQFARRKLSTC